MTACLIGYGSAPGPNVYQGGPIGRGDDPERPGAADHRPLALLLTSAVELVAQGAASELDLLTEPAETFKE